MRRRVALYLIRVAHWLAPQTKCPCRVPLDLTYQSTTHREDW